MRDDGAVRLFLAIAPPDGIIQEIVMFQERLQKIVTGAVRWVKPGGMHLTLKFFGDVPAAEIEQISEASGQTAGAAAPFTLSFRGLGTFPAAGRPRVIYLGMKGDTKRLTAFQKRLEEELAGRGFPGEKRPFWPHLTLARIKNLSEPGRFLRELAKTEAYETGPFTASELCLFGSELTPRGAVYTRLGAYQFALSARERARG